MLRSLSERDVRLLAHRREPSRRHLVLVTALGGTFKSGAPVVAHQGSVAHNGQKGTEYEQRH